ncbi:hypothetical protein XH80_15980 [Bradyrhizobium sp. CCBAU 45384]|nr:hypothetical protein [Bradyrhizobium sp. CCBAU 45384]
MERNILFRCPRTGMNVQHLLPGPCDDSSEARNSHVSVTCLACGSVHFVNTLTGKLLGEERGDLAANGRAAHSGRAT